MAIGNITSCRNKKQIQVEVYLRFSKNSFIMIFYMFLLIISQRIHLNSNEQDWRIGIGVVEICTDNLWFMSFNVRMRIEEGSSKNQLHQSYLGLFLAVLLQAKQSYKAAKPSVMRIPNHKKKVGPFPSPPLWFLFFSFHLLIHIALVPRFTSHRFFSTFISFQVRIVWLILTLLPCYSPIFKFNYFRF